MPHEKIYTKSYCPLAGRALKYRDDISQVDGKKVCQDPSLHLVAKSAVNLYGDVTQKEVEEYYARFIDKNDLTPISYDLNSRVVKDGKTYFVINDCQKLGKL